jgi:hypothetical protein
MIFVGFAGGVNDDDSAAGWDVALKNLWGH